MRRRKAATRAILLATLATTLTACATGPSPSFQTQAAPGAPLSSYRTYAWAFDNVAPGTANPVTAQRVRDSLDARLRSAGFIPASRDTADMIVAFTIGARDKVDVTDWGPVAPYYPAYGRAYRFGWAYPYNEVDVRNVTEGSMALDIFDGQTDRPVWHGIATERLGSSGASDELIQAATSGLVQRFVEARGG